MTKLLIGKQKKSPLAFNYVGSKEMFAAEICGDFLCFVFIRFGFWQYSAVADSMFFCQI